MSDTQAPLWVKILIGIVVAIVGAFVAVLALALAVSVGAMWLAWKLTVGLLMIPTAPVRLFGAGSYHR